MQNSTNKNCIKYENRVLEYLIPSSDLFKSLCLSEDKTKLFLISFIRSFIWLYVTDIYISYIYTTASKTYYEIIKSDKILILLITICLINIIYLVAVMFKKPHI
jgi:hypothetical protein